MPIEFAMWIHRQLHKMPGMPPHSEAAHRNRNEHAMHLPVHTHGQSTVPPHGPRPSRVSHAHHARPPRVLVAWQERISHIFAGPKGEE